LIPLEKSKGTLDFICIYSSSRWITNLQTFTNSNEINITAEMFVTYTFVFIQTKYDIFTFRDRTQVVFRIRHLGQRTKKIHMGLIIIKKRLTEKIFYQTINEILLTIEHNIYAYQFR